MSAAILTFALSYAQLALAAACGLAATPQAALPDAAAPPMRLLLNSARASSCLARALSSSVSD